MSTRLQYADAVTERPVLDRLQWWYRSNCDGDWEHTYGVDIGNLDNPGWSIRIALEDTGLESRQFEKVEIERTEEDWVHPWVEANYWNAATGRLNLIEALSLFLAWAEA